MNDEQQKEFYRKLRLRDLVLKFFMQARTSYMMSSEPPFTSETYSDDEIKAMMYALDTAGLIMHISGTGPSSYYETTDDGKILLEALSRYGLE